MMFLKLILITVLLLYLYHLIRSCCKNSLYLCLYSMLSLGMNLARFLAIGSACKLMLVSIGLCLGLGSSEVSIMCICLGCRFCIGMGMEHNPSTYFIETLVDKNHSYKPHTEHFHWAPSTRHIPKTSKTWPSPT